MAMSETEYEGQMPPLTELIERLFTPRGPDHPYWRPMSELNQEERAAICDFCRKGLAGQGLCLPPKFNGDDRMVAGMIRAIIRFGCTDQCEMQQLNMLTIWLHPDDLYRGLECQLNKKIDDYLKRGGRVEKNPALTTGAGPQSIMRYFREIFRFHVPLPNGNHPPGT